LPPSFPVHAERVSGIVEAQQDIDRLRAVRRDGSSRAFHDLERGCRQFARHWLYHESWAGAVCDLVDEDEGYVVKPRGGEVWNELGGATASSAAQYFMGVNSIATDSAYAAFLRERAAGFGAPRAEAFAEAARQFRERVQHDRA
jgi:hypothetical protein